MDVFGIEDVPQILEGDELEQVHDSFKQQVKQITENPSHYQNSENLKVGFELEYSLLDENNEQASEDARDQIKEEEAFLDSELAASVIETKTDPLIPDSLEELEQEIKHRENRTADLAAEKGLDLLRYGTNPFPSLDEFKRSGGPESRYEVFTNFLDEARNDEKVSEIFGENETIDPRDIHYSGAIASTQTNIQAKGLQDAVDKANLAYMFTPYAEALGGNSRIIEQKDLGIPDMRIPLWEASADIRSDQQFVNHEAPRAGRIDSYYGKKEGQDIEDYFERLDPIYVAPDVEEAPDAIDQAVMNNWKDVNIKFDRENGNSLVEIRPLSIQPSPREDLALSAFMIGRMAYAQEKDEELLDIGLVNENRENAMYEGLQTRLYDSSGELREATKVVSKELEYARQGLDSLDVDYENFIEGEYDLFDMAFEDRVETRMNPGDMSAEHYNEKRKQFSDREALSRVMEDYKVGGQKA